MCVGMGCDHMLPHARRNQTTWCLTCFLHMSWICHTQCNIPNRTPTGSKPRPRIQCIVMAGSPPTKIRIQVYSIKQHHLRSCPTGELFQLFLVFSTRCFGAAKCAQKYSRLSLAHTYTYIHTYILCRVDTYTHNLYIHIIALEAWTHTSSSILVHAYMKYLCSHQWRSALQSW